MCLLTTSTIRDLKRVFLGTQGLIANVYNANPDGLGVMYSDGRKLHVRKVLPRNPDEARQFIESLPDSDSDQMIACHWRMKTHGLVDMTNCHPYRVNDSTYLAHNGILHTGNAADPERSDTWHFIENYLSTLPTDALHDKKFLAMLGEFIKNNRFAIMSADGRLSVVNREQGIEAEGIWFSNTYAWSPGLLIEGYGAKNAALYPYQGWAFSGRGYNLDYLWDDDDLEPPYDKVETAVYEALENYDEEALEKSLRDAPGATVNKILNEFELELYGKTDLNDLTKYSQALVRAWLGADDAYLVKKAKHDPASVAQALLYYCEWTWVPAASAAAGE